MPYHVNTHVERLHRYLPFDASHDQIYEENRHSGDSLEIQTRALVYLTRVLEEGAKLVILTGDAGHGKTHLCNRLIRTYLGYTPEAARETVRQRCDGRPLVADPSIAQRRPLRIFKDFSEPTPDRARELLQSALNDPAANTIVCVNEGRLRSILAGDHGGTLRNIRTAFLSSFESGLASADGALHIVNLNYQSVAAEQDALIERVLSGEGQRLGWLASRRWSICDSCDARHGCPINRNARLLEGAAGKLRRERLREVLAVVERLGAVITIRETLMTVAYLLTGGLKCTDVHRRYARQPDGWQHEYMYYSLLFCAPQTLSRDQLARIPLLKELSAIDPGMIAERHVDERLINDPDAFIDGSFELTFIRRLGGRASKVDARHGIDEIVADARSREERETEAEFVRDVIRNLRRRDFFEVRSDDGLEAERLGFSYYNDFRWLLSDHTDTNRRVRIKNRLIAGLHTIQGLRLPRTETTLHLVDPAFGRSTNHAAIIARKIPSSQIRLLKQSEGWTIDHARRPYALTEAVDWIERQLLLTVDIAPGDQRKFPLDLLIFDCIMRAASGYLPETFYAHDIRRMMNFLGLLAERSRHEDYDSISIMVGGAMHTVALEEGDVIVVSGG